jgi:hypothetical protein
MNEQSKHSWDKGYADAMSGAASKCPGGLDELAYSSGYIAGEAQGAKRRQRVVTSRKASKDAP